MSTSQAKASGVGGPVAAGTWVEIERVVLTPEQRAPQAPADTRATPYLLHVSGFLTAAGAIGAEVEVETLIGRRLTGRLLRVEPRHEHSFGNVVPELLKIGLEGQ